MKIISLNTWGGRAGKNNLLSFFKKYQKDIDVFCLQEMWSAPYSDYEGVDAGGTPLKHEEIMTKGVKDISDLLSSHESYFHPHFLDNYGLQMLVNKNLKTKNDGDIFVYKERGYIPDDDLGNHARNIQYVTIEKDNKIITVINFHGLWNGKGKTDSEDRIKQSKNILNFIKSRDGSVVLCGDFNLLPDTKSLQIFENFGLRNLIKENNVTSTRSSFYKKPDKYADYIFVTKDLEIKDFKVLSEEVSDHLGLYIEVE